MAMVGPLAIHTDEDQEDSDFFDQLASEFGNGDLGHLHRGLEQEETERLDEAFSKLVVGKEGSTPAPVSSTIVNQIDEDNSAGDDFWLEENLVEDTSSESKAGAHTDADFSTAADSQVDFSPLNAPLNTEAIPSSRDLQAEAISSSDATYLDDYAVENKALLMESGSSVSVEDNAVLGALPVPAQAGSVSETECQIEGSVLDDASPPEVGGTLASGIIDLPCVPPQETYELDSSVLENKERTEQLTVVNSLLALTSDCLCDDAPDAQPIINNYAAFDPIDQSPDGVHMESINAQSLQNEALAFDPADQSIQNEAFDGVSMESVNAHSIQKNDLASATEIQLSPSVKELQWSSFGDTYIPDTFGSYSDFYSDLGNQTGVSSDQETFSQIDAYQVESLMEPSLTFSNAQVGSNAGAENLAASGFYGTAVGHFDETAFWNQQGVFDHGISEQAKSSPNITASFGESQAVELKQSGLGDAVVGGNYLLGSTNYEAQPQDEAQQNWENMYPGWYFDYASNQWRQIEGWGAVEEQLPSREEGDLAYLQTAQSGQVVSVTSDPTWQTSQGQAAWPALGSNESFAGTQVASNDQQVARDSTAEQQANWEEQYPGWYYDYQAQQWRQISDDSQSWASNQDNKLEASQVVVSANTSQILEGGWVEQQVEPHYQSGVNQNIYLPERSQSLYSSNGGDGMSTLTRGMSFNSWAEPAVGVFDVGQQGMGNMRQGGNTGSWTGFQGSESIPPSHTYQSVPGPTYQSQTDHNLADKSSLLSNSHGFFQPNNISGGVIDGTRSSSGHPSHALVAFGFGGKLVTMKAPRLGTSEPLVLQDLNQLVLNAEKRGQNDGFSYFSALNRHGLSGPLVGHGVTSKDLLKWVDEQIENCEREDFHGTSSEGLRVLWGVLKIACLHYGKLRSMAGSTGQVEDGPEVALGRFLMAAKNQTRWSQGSATSLDVLHSLPTGHQLQAAADEVRSRLMDGKRKEALQLAQQGQLWGLALVLAWQLGEKVYADTVLQMAQQQFSPGSPLRTLLLLFAGQTTELFKIQSLPLSAGTHGPFSSAISSPQDSAGGMLKDWLGNLSIIAANPTKGDEQVITHLGDSLWKDQGEVAGAHTCYLVAETSFELFSKEARLCLVGADHFKYQRTFATPQAIQRTELYEYAKSLGNPQYVLVPFQPFKLLYAHMLAEAGKITEACRYCQMVTKGLKNAGRGAEIEFCKQSAVALEERLRQHSQGGYSLNFSTGKLVGKVMGTIDSTIHKIIGGPPVPPVSQPSPAFGNPQDWYANDPKYGNAGAFAKAAPLIPSASNSNLFNVNSQVDVPTRSISEPNLIRSSTQEVYMTTTTTSAETASAPPKQLKSEGSGGGYLGRFGSQIFAKAIGYIKHNKEAKLGDENKFYYDEKLKRWVETGVEQSTEEAALAPPPIVASFNSSFGTPSTDAKSGGNLSLSSSADLPPMPPSVNQFSARGRLSGVRSRYVDTFNKGNAEPAAKPSRSPIVPPGGGWGMTSTPSQFFASASVPSATDGSSQVLANGHINDGSPEFLKLASDNPKGGHLQVEHEPMLPKNLTTSFMNVPVIQKHSSASDIAMLTSNDLATNKSGTFGISTPGNMARAVSWSGDSPNASVSSTYATHRLPNGSIADEAAFSATTLPSPPIIEPPASFTGYERSGMQAVAAGNMLSGSLQGAAYGEMQEVEL